MIIGQRLWTQARGWVEIVPQTFPRPPQLILAFGNRQILEDPQHFEQIRSYYPDSNIIQSSTAGEIIGDEVRDHTISVTAVLFEKTALNFAEAEITSAGQSQAVGKQLADQLPKKNLVHAMVFSDGLLINGTALVKGLNDNLPAHVSVTGGLAGDGPDFKKTLVGLDHIAQVGKVVLVGFSGQHLKVGYGSLGGWDAFGIERLITKSTGNVLYELDGKPVLELYKTYLGDKAKDLPGSGLLFPLRLHMDNDDESEVVRTVLGINESDQSLTFAGEDRKSVV